MTTTSVVDTDVPAYTRECQAAYVRFNKRSYGRMRIARRHPKLFAKLAASELQRMQAR